jgi:hypothetical protein
MKGIHFYSKKCCDKLLYYVKKYNVWMVMVFLKLLKNLEWIKYFYNAGLIECGIERLYMYNLVIE